MSAVQTLLGALDSPEASLFTDSFLERVSVETVAASLLDVHKRFGKPQTVHPIGDDLWQVQSERGQYQVLARFDQTHRVQALRLPTPAVSPLKAKATFMVLLLMPLFFARSVVLSWSQPALLAWLTDILPSLTFGAALIAVSAWAQSATWLKPLFWLGMAMLALSSLRALHLPVGQLDGFDAVLSAVLVAALLPLLLQGWRGRQIPRSIVELGPVLSGGRFMVAQGGSTPTINYHVAHEHMRYAVDFIGVNAWGRHATGLLPADPEKYAIFGAEVLAPLSGQVVAARDGLPDLSIPQTDALRPAGNHVVLRCLLPDGQTVQVLLAHLKQGSVRVSPGNAVKAGEIIGQVGNSGNTTEPHLHLGVNRHTVEGDPFSGEGVPFSVEGRFPIRGMVYERQGA